MTAPGWKSLVPAYKPHFKPTQTMANSQRSTSFGPREFISECRALWVIAWPMFVAQIAQMGTGVVDTIMAGHYNAVDLAAIAIGAQNIQ